MHRLILTAGLVALCGCGGPKPLEMAGTPESSRAVLVDALEGWKAGHSFHDLLGQSPPLLFGDDDLNRGARLLDYRVETDAKVNGTGYSYVVALTVQEKDGGKPPVQKRVAYTAVTEPKRAVSREDRKP